MSWRRFTIVDLMTPPEAWPTGAPLVATVPGEEVATLEVELPLGVRPRVADRIARTAAFYHTGTPPEETHIVRLDRGGDPAHTRILAVANHQMAAWRARTAAAGRRIAALLPDYLVVPETEQGWTIMLEASEREPRIRARLASDDGFSAEMPLALAILEQLLEQSQQPPRVIAIHAGLPLKSACDFLVRKLGNTSATVTTGEEPPLTWYEGPVQDVNLLTGPFGQAHNFLGQVRRWQWPAAGAVAAVALWVVNSQIELAKLQAASAAANDRITAVFRGSFDADAPIVDARIQAARILDRLRAAQAGSTTTADFPALMEAASGVLQQRLNKMRALEYANGSLEVHASLTNFQELEALRTALLEQWLSVRMLSSAASADTGVEARFTLSASAAGRTQ